MLKMATNDSASYSFVWNEAYWFPEKHDFGWKDLKNEPGTNIYYPQIEDLNWSILIGIGLIFIRYLLEIIFVVPIGIYLGLSNKKRSPISPNPHLEAAFKKSKKPDHALVKTLSKQTDLTERQIEVWFRKRNNMYKPSPLQKFRECRYMDRGFNARLYWHLIFYSIFFIYGISILWKKDYFWKTIHCWENWPSQHVSNDMYWYYVLELGFYWGLVLTLFTDNKRKDLKEMIIHHFATITLLYFSWVLNFVRIGTLVLAVHDAADSWLALAKMSVYIKNKTATDIFFGIFLVVWVISRLIVYPYVVLYSTTVEPYTAGLMDKTFVAHLFFNFFLYLLQVLHLIWSFLIFRIVYRKIKKGEVEDVRSESEDDSGEESDDELDEKTETKNGTTHQNGLILQNGHSLSLVNRNQETRMPDAIHNGNGNVVKRDPTLEEKDGEGYLNGNNKKSASPSRIPRARKN